MSHSLRTSMALCAALAWFPAACAHGPAHPGMVAPRAAVAPVARAVPATDAFLDLDGQPVTLDKYARHTRVLAFLAPGGDSAREAVLLLRLASAYADKGVVIVGAGEQATADELRAFVGTSGITFPFWQDPDGTALAAHGFTGVPAFVFIDREGKERGRHAGFASRGELTAAIEGILP